MADNQENWLKHLPKEILDGIQGNYLDSYMVALEGWRRGLTLKWHIKDHEKFKDLKTWFVDEPGQLFSLSNGEKVHYFFRTRGDLITNEAVEIGKSKQKTKEYLEKANVKVPEGKEFNEESTIEEIKAYAESLGYPVVVKPTDGSFGRGVYTNVLSDGELEFSVQNLREQLNTDRIIIEKYVDGEDFRLYVIENEVVGAMKRIPPNVVGDGKHTIRQLIEQKNLIRQDNPRLINCQIKINNELKDYIGRHNLSLDTVVEEGKQIFLSKKCNISIGGDPIDVLNDISPDAKQIAINALKAIPNMSHGAVDLMVDRNGQAYVIEVNATAQIGGLLFPIKGESRDIPSAIIDYYFPETKENKGNKSQMFFDFYDVLDPLFNHEASSTTVTPAPLGKVFAKKYIVTGDVQNMGYHRGLRKQAFERELHGYVMSVEDEGIEVVVAGLDPEMVDDFKNGLYEDPERSEVKEVREEPYEGFLNVGFEIKLDLKTQINEINDYKKQLERLDLEIKKEEKKRRKFKQSFSWKVSSPIRLFGAIVKRIK